MPRRAIPRGRAARCAFHEPRRRPPASCALPPSGERAIVSSCSPRRSPRSASTSRWPPATHRRGQAPSPRSARWSPRQRGLAAPQEW